MANEITVVATLKYAKNKSAAQLATSHNADQSGDKYEAGIQTVGTVEEQLTTGDVGRIGYLAVRNTDAVNFCQLGSSAGNYSLKLLAGKAAVVRWSGSAVCAKAVTTLVDAECVIIDA